MKNLITLKSYDGAYTFAINPDHIVKFYENDMGCCVKLSNGDVFTAGIKFYDLIELINKSYE